MTQENHYIVSYIDDHVLFGSKQQCQRAFDRLTALLGELGLTISVHKNVPPTTEAVCLGILVNTKNSTLSIPPKKLKEIKSLVENWSHKKTCSKNQLQSLLGSLLFVSKCVKYSRFFLNRLLDTLRSNAKNNIINLDGHFHRDVNWFKKFVEKFNGTTFFDKSLVQGTIYLDACLSGMGAIFEKQVYHVPTPPDLVGKNIAILEMYNILVAIRVWSKHWKGKTIQIFCDNEAVVTVLNTGKTRESLLATISRNIFMQSAKWDISLTFTHIQGTNNDIADLLSRWDNSPHHISKLNRLVPEATWLAVDNASLTLDYDI